MVLLHTEAKYRCGVRFLEGEADAAPSNPSPFLSDSGDLDAIYCTPLHHACGCVRALVGVLCVISDKAVMDCAVQPF